MRSRRNAPVQLAALGCWLWVTNGWAAGRALEAEPVENVKIRIDGDLREWPNRMTELAETLAGKPAAKDPRVATTLAYDERNLYVVLKIFDGKLVRSAAANEGEDHASLYLAFPRGKTYEVELFPGQPGKVPGLVKLGGQTLAGATLVEAPAGKGGLHVEAQIPWTAFPDAVRTRVGLRASVTYSDADAPGDVEAVVGTSGARSAPGMPPLLFANEQGLEAAVRAKSLPSRPSREAYGNVAGDAMLERVGVWGNQLVIIGPHFRGGKEFYFSDLGPGDETRVTRLELHDFDGDGRDEVVMQRRVGSRDKYRDVLTVLKVGADDSPFLAFAHEVGIKTKEGSIENKVQIGKSSIEIAQGESEGFEPATFAETQPDDMGATLLPWESVGRRSYVWSGTAFEAEGEAPNPNQRASRSPKASGEGEGVPKAPPAPRPPSADELLERVYALYKKERGVHGGKPSFDFVTDVAGDAGPERVLVHGKDLLVFGKGFRQGQSYAFITMGGVEASDVLDVTSRDLTGDGKAELIVRALLRIKASKALGGDTVNRHALFVYGVQGDGIVRIFAAETGRSLAKNQILGSLTFTPGARGLDIELRPARAVGWTEASYPFPADTSAAGGLEPLLLPWSGGARKYGFDGTAFVAK